jgi:hypothetical protein
VALIVLSPKSLSFGPAGRRERAPPEPPVLSGAYSGERFPIEMLINLIAKTVAFEIHTVLVERGLVPK